MRSASRWLATSAAVAALVACTPASETPERDRGATPSPAPRPRGEAVVVVVGAPATLDPYDRRAGPLTWALVRPVYRSLFRLAPDGSPVPDLAERVEERSGGAVVHLARGAHPRDVVASARRARPPSGFAGLRVRRAGPRAVLVRGDVEDWRARLAAGTWVLPGGRATGTGGGPFRVARHRRGFEVVLRARPGAPAAPRLARVRVRVAAGTDTALALLEEGRADAGWVPSTINLEARAEAAGLRYRARRGWEEVVLDFAGSGLPPPQRRWVARRARAGGIVQGLVRDAGERAGVLGGVGAPPGAVLLAAPAEDELLRLVARALHRRLFHAGVEAEAVAITTGDALPPHAARLGRRIGAPGMPRPRGAVPLYRVDSVLVWRGLGGPQPNPTLDGPLWNLEAWSRE